MSRCALSILTCESCGMGIGFGSSAAIAGMAASRIAAKSAFFMSVTLLFCWLPLGEKLGRRVSFVKTGSPAVVAVAANSGPDNRLLILRAGCGAVHPSAALFSVCPGY